MPKPSESIVKMTQLVMPPNANAMGTLFGGQLVAWMDMAASVAAMRHARSSVVTVAIDQLSFDRPIRVGDAVLLEARVSWVGRTSIEVQVVVQSEDLTTGRRVLTNTAFLTFVAIDADGRPKPVPPLECTTPEERALFAAAAERRAKRLAARQKEG